LNGAFAAESAVDLVVRQVKQRWQEVHSAGTDTTPVFRPLDLRFAEFIRNVEVVLHPDEAGRERSLDDLSDGQRSLFHLAMTAATLDIEAQVAANPAGVGFQNGGVPLPALTLIAVEEPENNLAPFYLSRIIRQIDELTHGQRAQAIVASHSPSILARIEPSQVRHFRLDPGDRTARVRPIHLPEGQEEASKFVREAVRSYPELYFARFVVLGEGASEEVVLPRLADATGFAIDRSFVAVVPLGGRHVNHLWRLLTDLGIPYATLLDLDWGRAGGGWGRIKTVCAQLLVNDVKPGQIFRDPHADGPEADLAAFDAYAPRDYPNLTVWVTSLRRFGVFFCVPLDLDYSMLQSFPAAYQTLEPGMQGPSPQGDARKAVLGDGGLPQLYRPKKHPLLRWYRYLFLGRGKPSTHVRVLCSLPNATMAANAPEELRALIAFIREHLTPTARANS
jgi:putative ATP-dependent endonuclease of the OLD family